LAGPVPRPWAIFTKSSRGWWLVVCDLVNQPKDR
jgi:hypothetical protein